MCDSSTAASLNPLKVGDSLIKQYGIPGVMLPGGSTSQTDARKGEAARLGSQAAAQQETARLGSVQALEPGILALLGRNVLDTTILGQGRNRGVQPYSSNTLGGN